MFGRQENAPGEGYPLTAILTLTNKKCQEMMDLSRSLRMPWSCLQSGYVHPASHTMAVHCKAKRESRLCGQPGLCVTVPCSVHEVFVRAMQVHQSSVEQRRHHVLTCAGATYKPQYFNTLYSNRSWFLLLLSENKLAVEIFITPLSQIFQIKR